LLVSGSPAGARGRDAPDLGARVSTRQSYRRTSGGGLYKLKLLIAGGGGQQTTGGTVLKVKNFTFHF